MPFLVLSQHEQFYAEGLSYSGLDEVSSEIQGLSSTNCNFLAWGFQGLKFSF